MAASIVVRVDFYLVKYIYEREETPSYPLFGRTAPREELNWIHQRQTCKIDAV